MRRFITDIIFIISSITFVIYLFMVYFADFDTLNDDFLYGFAMCLGATIIAPCLCFLLTKDKPKAYDDSISEESQADIKTIVETFSQNKTKHSIALLGKWGCGKTYLWEHFIRPKIAIKYEITTSNLAKSMAIVCGLFLLACLNDDLIKLIRTYFCVSYFGFFKPIFLFPILLGLFIYIRIFSSYKNSIIYISLYGKNDFKSAIDEIYQKSQDSKDYLIRLLNGLSSKITGIENLFYKLDEDGFENKIICIDDIERRPKSMELEDVFGLVSHLKEIKKCHVLAIFGEGVYYVGEDSKWGELASKFDNIPKPEKPQKDPKNTINYFVNHDFFEKTFDIKIDMSNNYFLLLYLVSKSSIKLSLKGKEGLIKFIYDLEEYKIEGTSLQANIRCFEKILQRFERKLKILKLLELDKDFLEFYYADFFKKVYGIDNFNNPDARYFGHAFWLECERKITNNSFATFDSSYRYFIDCYKTYEHLNAIKEFYAASVEIYNFNIFLKHKIFKFQILFLLRLAYEDKCNYKEDFRKIYENILNYTISDLSHLKNVIKLLKKYDFTKDIKCNEEINSKMSELMHYRSDKVYFHHISLYNLYKLILNDNSQGFEAINNSYFKVSLELLLALLLDFDTQDDENHTKVINKLKEILGTNSIE